MDDALQRADGRVDATPVNDRLVTEPGSRYIDFLIPGLLGFSLMSGGRWGVGRRSAGLVRGWRRVGTQEHVGGALAGTSWSTLGRPVAPCWDCRPSAAPGARPVAPTV